MEHDMKILGHCHCSVITKDDDMVEMDVCECSDGRFAVLDSCGDGGYEPDTIVATFEKEDDAYAFVYKRLRELYGDITPMSGAGCPNEFLSHNENI